mmetsp:Transcript_9344/g.20265  ORF Transcript_9344/g.20265 Transcript_9344/m.20265 type:complete len:148 (+) Transcript_9344:71-514(+)
MRAFSSGRYSCLLAFSLLVTLGMISSFGARAFTAARVVTRRVSSSSSAGQRMPTNFARFMSSSPGETSVVDVCTEKIRDALETSEVKVTGAYDDPNGSHVSIEVVSEKFEGKRAMQRQQMVYKAIWEELQGPVHAVDSMICKTPEEA